MARPPIQPAWLLPPSVDGAAKMMRVDQPIVFDREDIVHLDKGTYHWVSLKWFGIDSDQSDRMLLEALVAHWQYHDHYAGVPVADQIHHRLHGPYRLECISAETFRPAHAAAAQALVQAWAVAATSKELSPRIRRDLDQRVYAALDTDSLFQLPDLRPDAEHEWGWVVGRRAFHEFVAINRADRTMILIVAADD